LAQVPPGVDPDGVITSSRINLLLLRRKFTDILTILQQLHGEIFHTEGTAALPKSLLEGISYLGLNDEKKARPALENARQITERAVLESPDEASRHALLGGILAYLGRNEEAIKEGKRAVELAPESKDAFDGPQMTVALAQIYAWTGEKVKALQLLEHLLSTPAGISVVLLKLDPVWDPLRNDPRFQALIDKYSAKA